MMNFQFQSTKSNFFVKEKVKNHSHENGFISKKYYILKPSGKAFWRRENFL